VASRGDVGCHHNTPKLGYTNEGDCCSTQN